MKVEVINRSTKDPIEIYSVRDLSMLDFQEWKESSEIMIHLDCLLDTVKNLDSRDAETQEPISNPTEVDFYLPDSLIENILHRLAKSQTDTEESPDQFEDRLNEVKEWFFTPELKSSTMLFAVVTAILQNHHPHSDYEVRISDG